MTFWAHIYQQIPWHKISVLKIIYDVVNKVYAFKFENLSISIAFLLPSMETETKFHVFQSDLATK